jgi:hypothetical protein
MKIKKLILIFILGTSVASADPGSTYGGFTFSSDLSPERVRLLKDDLDFLYALPELKDSTDFLKLSGMTDLSGPNFHNWILNRIQFFVSDLIELNVLFGFTSQAYKYENQNQLPDLPPASAQNRIEQNVVLADNVSSAAYLSGKLNKFLNLATINGNSVPILSPRVGIMRLSESYFDKSLQPLIDPQAPVSRIVRLSTLFHEARHSDGHGKNVTFPHVQCPEGHAYANEAACDRMENGSYGLEARFDKVMAKNCVDCKPGEIEVLRMLAIDNFSRLILPPAATARLASLQSAISNYKFIMDLCRSSKIKDPECSAEIMKERNQKYLDTRAQLDYMVRTGNSGKVVRPTEDPKPEGFFQEQNLEQSRALMNR